MLPMWLYQPLVVLFIMSWCSIIILNIGWLTHANYYYKIYNTIDEFGIWVFNFIFGILSVIGSIAFFVSIEFFCGVMMVNAMCWVSIVMLILINYMSMGISNIRNYFAKKRGRY